MRTKSWLSTATGVVNSKNEIWKFDASLVAHNQSEDAGFAARVEKALRAARIGVWLDRSKIWLGVLLRKELPEAIDGARVVVLWSKPAARSRWVASEIPAPRLPPEP